MTEPTEQLSDPSPDFSPELPTPTSASWPAIDDAAVSETAEHLHRIVQIAGKYTLSELFEPGWGNVVLEVTPRGLRTPVFAQHGRVFDVHYRLLDHDVVIEADTGRASLELAERSVADFLGEFQAAARQLGLPGPGSLRTCEIPDAVDLDVDTARRPWDRRAATAIWSALSVSSAALRAWQAPFRGYRPRVGVMWGGFDLSATRYRARYADPPADRPPFMQHGMSEHYVSVGLAFADAHRVSETGLYAYIAPQPPGMDSVPDWGVEGARWDAEAGLVLLPWRHVRELPAPAQATVAFGDAVYDAACLLAGWPADLVGPRFDGWYASTNSPAPRPSPTAAHDVNVMTTPPPATTSGVGHG